VSRLSAIFRFGDTERDRRVARNAALLPSGSRVLDVSAGPCRYRPLFPHCDNKTQDFMQHEGSNVGPLADKGQWGYGQIDYVSDAMQIPVADGFFDAVLCTEVMEHVPEPIRVVNELSRILRGAGGCF